MQVNSSRTLKALRYGAIALVLAAATYGAASLDWCRRGAGGDLRLERSEAAEGTLLVGGARVDLELPLPVVVAGYPPQRSEARRILSPLRARALVLQVDRLRVALVSTDLFTSPEPLAAAIRAALQDRPLAQAGGTRTHLTSPLR